MKFNLVPEEFGKGFRYLLCIIIVKEMGRKILKLKVPGKNPYLILEAVNKF